MIYFSSQDVPRNADTGQLEALRRAEKDYRDRGFVETFENPEDFRRKFGRHLAKRMVKYLQTENHTGTNRAAFQDAFEVRLPRDAYFRNSKFEYCRANQSRTTTPFHSIFHDRERWQCGMPNSSCDRQNSAKNSNGSKHKNMKEIRFKQSDGVWRFAFAFTSTGRRLSFAAVNNQAEARNFSTSNL